MALGPTAGGAVEAVAAAPAMLALSLARLAAVSESAAQAGVLRSFVFRVEAVPLDVRVPRTNALMHTVWRMRVIESESKSQAGTLRPQADPFDPYEPELFVAFVRDRHVALLNKFNVVPYSMLLVTKRNEPQMEHLNRADWLAIVDTMRAVPGLTFFNRGSDSGSSQPHKHVQHVPLPDDETRQRELPLHDWVLDERSAVRADAPGTVAVFPFVHAAMRLRDGWLEQADEAAAAYAEASYWTILRAAGCVVDEGAAPSLVGVSDVHYNLLCTPQWMMVVPRSAEKCTLGMSHNSLAFTGALLVRNEAQRAALLERGPLQSLVEVTFPRA